MQRCYKQLLALTSGQHNRVYVSVQERILKAPIDVEELSRLGGRQGVCPYYASRAAVPAADVVLLPYSALLAQVQARNCMCNEKQANMRLGEGQVRGPKQLLWSPLSCVLCHFRAKK